MQDLTLILADVSNMREIHIDYWTDFAIEFMIKIDTLELHGNYVENGDNVEHDYLLVVYIYRCSWQLDL